VSFVIGCGLVSATSLTAAAEVLEGDGAPTSTVGAECDAQTEVLPKEISPDDLRPPPTPKGGSGGFIEGTQ
jgi:hypothetical protein